MDGRRFDDFARRLGGVSSRRRVVLGALLAAGGFAAAADHSDAADRICRLGGDRCVRNSQCCSGVCRTGAAFRRSMRHTCTCHPICTGRCGGDDGCGGACPDNCTGSKVCNPETTRCCTPRCSGRCAGNNGCGGECPDICTGDDVCHPDTGVCCTPNCDGKCGGDDGCGGVCPDICTGNDVCHPDTDVCCTPNCGAKVCGDDGCGGTCGTECAAGLVCKPDGTACVDVCFDGARGKRCLLATNGKFFLNTDIGYAATDNGTNRYCLTDADCAADDGCDIYAGMPCVKLCITKDYANGSVNWSGGSSMCRVGTPSSNLPKDARCSDGGQCASGTCAADGYCA